MSTGRAGPASHASSLMPPEMCSGVYSEHAWGGVSPQDCITVKHSLSNGADLCLRFICAWRQLMFFVSIVNIHLTLWLVM